MTIAPPPPALIALYHAVGTPAASGYRDAVSRQTLARQLDWLAAHYEVVPLERLVERRRRGESLAGLAALTFDDNHRSVLEEALPMAAARGLPTTWFLIAGPLRGASFWRRQVTELERRDEVAAFLAFARQREPAAANLRAERFYRDSKDPARIASPRIMTLLDAWFRARGRDCGPPADFVTAEEISAGLPWGVALGNHGDRHPVLAGLDEAAQRADIRHGREGLRALLAGRPGPALSAALALPFGDPQSWDATTLAAAAAEGVSALLTVAPGLAPAEPPPPHRVGDLPILQRALLGRALADTADR